MLDNAAKRAPNTIRLFYFAISKGEWVCESGFPTRKKAGVQGVEFPSRIVTRLCLTGSLVFSYYVGIGLIRWLGRRN